jgi:glycosyltransferase involved in cell wall biosynthesis
MTNRKLLLLLGFTDEDTKMASVRWRRFRKHLSPDEFSFEWIPVKLPFCDDSAGAPAKALRELTVLRHAARQAGQIARGRDPQVRMTVLASIPPLDPLYVGVMLKRACRADVELVLEIRDVYARPELYEYRPVRRRLEVLKEKLLIRYVDRLIYLTEEIQNRYRAYYPRRRSVQEGAVITNGYDPQEYGPGPGPAVATGRLEIGYFGSFYASRNPELLFQALRLLRTRGPAGFAALRLHIWGEADGYPLEARITAYGLQDTVAYHGIASHDQILRQYRRTGANLIITHTAGSSYALPGKLFEYIGARRPIWAITEDQILRDFITRHKLGYLSTHRAESIARTLSVLLRDHARPEGLREIRRLEDFELTALTRQLKHFLHTGFDGPGNDVRHECRQTPSC